MIPAASEAVLNFDFEIIKKGPPMNHKGTVQLETARLILRRFQTDDYETSFRNWQGDTAVTPYVTWQNPANLEESKMTLDHWMGQYENPDFYQWAITLKDVNEPIGTISVVNIKENAERMEIGYVLGSRWWHQGIVAEAFTEVIRFLFEEVQAQNIIAVHDTRNPNSGAVMRKCGMHYEGTLRKYLRCNEGIGDVCIYSYLAEEYQIRKGLFALQDEKYREFNASLIPNLPKEKFIGVRTPALRNMAKEMAKNGTGDLLLGSVPHRYFEEDQLHAFLLSDIKDADAVFAGLEQFLPYIDNWATCDQLRPKVLKKPAYKARLLDCAKRWIISEGEYTRRYAVGVLHYYFMDDDFETEHLHWVAAMEPGTYYIDMMNAWYFATALTKHYEAALPLIEAKTLDPWVHNKSIQKARESRIIPEERKKYLKTLKI